MTRILQSRIPYDPLAPRPLPGIAPLNPDDWVLIDEAYGAQMAERERLMAVRPDEVLALSDGAKQAAQEVLRFALAEIDRLGTRGFKLQADTVICPDGRCVTLDADRPLATLSRLLQDDICIMQKIGDEHVLTGAALCFPASWTLAQKFMRPMGAIHRPVDSYDADIAKRVQRLFDGVRVGRPLWRFNAHWYSDPALYQPRPENDPRPLVQDGMTERFMRSERQALMRLPTSDAVVFSIHTFVMSEADVMSQRPEPT